MGVFQIFYRKWQGGRLEKDLTTTVSIAATEANAAVEFRQWAARQNPPIEVEIDSIRQLSGEAGLCFELSDLKAWIESKQAL